MTVKQRIETKIKSVFAPQHIEVLNESDNHAGPKGRETHFKLLLVAKGFSGKTLIERHRMVYGLLDEEMKNGVHALALQTYTPEEWVQYQTNRKSPPCAGGEK